jgi:hypothetical protein
MHHRWRWSSEFSNCAASSDPLIMVRPSGTSLGTSEPSSKASRRSPLLRCFSLFHPPARIKTRALALSTGFRKHGGLPEAGMRPVNRQNVADCASPSFRRRALWPDKDQMVCGWWFGRKSSGVESVSGWSFRCHRFKFWWCYLNRAETHRWNFNSLGRIMVLNNGGVPICL